MSEILKSLKPENVWKFFSEILQIPRPSKKEEKIITYLLSWAKERNLEAMRDEIGNVLIRKPATMGMENRQSVCLQAHTDMVCEKNSDKVFDFEKNVIIPVIKNGWVTADGTTLGADDGIGIATILAILDSKDIAHGNLECLFTVDEETGLSGAFALKKDWLNSRILINLDSEDEGEIFIGCAGGINTLIKVGYKKTAVPAHTAAFKVMVRGLNGGHSGDDINKGLACANKVLNRVLWNANEKFGLRISVFDGGNLRNAIAREAFAIVTIPNKNVSQFRNFISEFNNSIRQEFHSTEKNLTIECETTTTPEFVIDEKTESNLLNALYACPHGVLAMSREIPNFVETSTNLASVKMDDQYIYITTSQRSSIESGKVAAAQKVAATFRLIGGEISHSDGYPGWTPNPNSKILKVAETAYEHLFGKQPIVRAIHAGLECGLIGEKYPGMDMISYGPTLRGVHSPAERIEIETVQKFWDHTLEILKNIPFYIETTTINHIKL